MTLYPITYVAANYRDYGGWWLKAYAGTSTAPLSMFTDADGNGEAAKFQLNVDGFLVSSGGAIVNPFIGFQYTLYLFPTEEEANNNDTIEAIRVAYDIDLVGNFITKVDINNYTTINFDTVANAKAGMLPNGDTVTLKVGDLIYIEERGNALFKGVSTGVANGYNILDFGDTFSINFQLINGDYNTKSWGVNSAERYQYMLNNVPNDTTIINDSQVDLTTGLDLNVKGTIIKGKGKHNFIAGMEGRAAFHVYADSCKLHLWADNPNELGNTQSGTARPYGIAISANDVEVSKCTLTKFQNPITQRTDGEWYRAKVVNNWCLDVLGAGQGQSSTSGDGEDRGDGITIWGAGSVVSNNVVVLKDGQDGRVGIHAESLDTLAPTPGDYPDACVTFTGNLVQGAFRRSLAFEGMDSATATGNVLIGATWWSMAQVVGCKACVMSDNTVYWNTPYNTWAAWSPAIGPIMQFGALEGCSITDNKIFMKAGSTASSLIHMQNVDQGIQVDCEISNNVFTPEDDTVTCSNSLIRVSEFNENKALRQKVINNTVKANCLVGVLLEDCEDLQLKDNTIISTAATKVVDSYGLYNNDAAILDFIIADNTFKNWETGARIPSVSSGEIEHNTFDTVTDAITFGATATNVKVTRNKWRSVTGSKVSGFPETMRGLVRDNADQFIYAELDYDPISVPSGGSTQKDFTVSGAGTGDFVSISAEINLGGMMYSAYASAVDTITLVLFNPTSGSIDRPNSDFRIEVNKIGNFI